VSVELYDVPAAFRAFERFAPQSRLARQARDHSMAARHRALGADR